MFDFDYIPKEDIKEHNLSWPVIPDYPYKILTVGVSGSGKPNGFLIFYSMNQVLIKVVYMQKI